MACPSESNASSGFTLIEVVVALFLLAGIALLLADITFRATRTADRARRQSVMTTMAEARMEQLLGLNWGLGEAEAPAPTTDTGTDLSAGTLAPGGTGLDPTPIDALQTDEPGHSDFADRRGNWLASGPSVPAGAAFVRRWRIATVPGAPDCLSLEVLVDTLDAERRARPPSPSALRLSVIKARKAA